MDDATTATSPQPLPEAKPGRSESSWFWPWFWRTFLVVSLAYAWYCFYVPSNGIAWANDFDSAQQQAAKSGKPMILFFTGEWCVPCRIMKRVVWADEQVEATVNAGYTPVTIYVDDPDAVAELKDFQIGATPTTIITDAQGNVLEHVRGGLNKAEFLKLLSKHHQP